MDALTFLYWSLGVGWAALIVFLCVALIYVIRILRDVANTTELVRNTAETMNDNVNKITDRIVNTAEQITEYIVKPFTVAQYLAEKLKPFIDVIRQKGEEFQDMMESKKKSSVEEEPSKKKKRKFRKKKEK